jgi:hypothetical protein
MIIDSEQTKGCGFAIPDIGIGCPQELFFRNEIYTRTRSCNQVTINLAII